MNLARMMTDKFFIEGQGGTRIGPFKTRFGSGTLMVFHDDFRVAQGDRIIQPLADGSERIYVVQSSSFTNGSRNIPSHFSVGISEHAETQTAAMTTMGTALDCPDIGAALQWLAQGIECADAPLAQMNEASALLRALLDNPIVATVLADAGSRSS